MIPLKDNIPSKTFPFITIFLIITNFIVFFYEISLGSDIINFLDIYGFVPKRLFILKSFYIYKYGTLITSIFLHAGWLHLLGNMLYLWIFGDNVEDMLGHIKFLFFYIFCGITGTLAQIIINPLSKIPIIGASGAIAGVLGAYFIFFPKSRVLTVVPIFFFIRIIEITSVLFIGFWFIIQFFNGTSSYNLNNIFEGGVAWWAHIGGFISGFLFSVIFKIRKSISK
ncbi:MAG: rhomboid family intramembrane serine protease [Candidatus Firestonebacteria bacterium]|nr:rhomboid family intramembrane serine protease [Candidatus Firestonebacteria bacterium]